MKTIPLTQGKSALVDDEDFEYLSQWKWHVRRTEGDIWYAVRAEPRINGKQRHILMHRLLCPGKEIDHRDGNGLNNQKENLRSVSHSVNAFNSKRIGKSGVRGVSRFRGKWRAQIACKGKEYFLGNYVDFNDAKEARRLAEIKYFGEAYKPKVA